MNKLLDKLVLFTLCLAVYLMHESGSYVVVPVIIAVFVSAADAYFNNATVKWGLFAVFATACVVSPLLLLFLPMLCYDMPYKRWQWTFAAAVPICASFLRGQSYIGIFAIILIMVCKLMSYHAETIERGKREYIALRDSAKELSISLEDKNRELLQKQDYEVNLATLSERNRIARDIHDSVGHVLSSALLQVGAVIATCGDEAVRQRLETVKSTLTQGMDSIRVSVHDLYDESIDLYAEVRGIVGDFTFCPITFDFDIEESPDKKVKYAFIAIIKEALVNTAKHSDATTAAVTLHEQSEFYSLMINDNGRGMANARESAGIGLRSIAVRVEGIGGTLNINGENGFRICISVPKGRDRS